MKCQFATIESIASLSIVVSALIFASILINNSNSAYYANYKSAASNMAIYDFVQQLSQNKSFSACMLDENSSAFHYCASSYIGTYEKIYGLSAILIASGNNSVGTINGVTSKACMTVSSQVPVCIIVGD